MCERWDRGGTSFQSNILDEMLRLTIDVLGRTAFSYDFKSVSVTDAADSALFSSFDIILKSLAGASGSGGIMTKIKGAVLPNWMWDSKQYVEGKQKFKRAMGKLDGQVEEIISARRAAEADEHGTEELPQVRLFFPTSRSI